ncbi:MAG: hypothetical protein RL582_1016 [Bacteroidota bacterium]
MGEQPLFNFRMYLKSNLEMKVRTSTRRNYFYFSLSVMDKRCALAVSLAMS